MTEDEFDRTARLWLEDGPKVMPDRGLTAALDEIHVTRQRRSWWPARRVSAMHAPIRLAIGATAVILAAVIGISLLPGRSTVAGGPAAAPTLSPAPTPAPTPTPIALRVTEAPAPLTPPGRYVAGDPFPVPVTFAVPAGWTGNVGGQYAAWLDKAGTGDAGGAAGAGGAEIALSLSQSLYADPCTNRGLLAPQPGPAVDDLASALTKLPGFVATTPTAVSVSGFSGKQLTLTAPASFAGCTLAADVYRLWTLPLGAVTSFAPGEQMTMWILDVNGQRLTISSATDPATTPQDRAEVQQILDSIQIGSPN